MTKSILLAHFKPAVFMIALVFLLGCIEDEKGDFTSENNYPPISREDPPDDPDDEEDTVVIPPVIPCWDDSLGVVRSAYFIDLFTRYGDGWTGGDATYSILLPDGRTLWIFGDTFFGTVREDRSRPGTGLARNSFVVQDGDLLTTLNQNGETMITPSTDGWWYWPVDGTIYNDTLQILLSAFKTTPEGGMWGFQYASTDLALFTLPDFQLISIETRIPDPTTALGACVMEDDGYIYIYGVEGDGGHKYINVARAADGDIRKEWEYYNGTDWVTDFNQRARIWNDVSEQFAIFKDNGMYYLVTQNYALGDEIYLLKSSSPVGPWHSKTTVYCTPESGGGIFTYNAFAHPQFSEQGELLISYNINSFNFGDLFENADNYRPYFITIDNWR